MNIEEKKTKLKKYGQYAKDREYLFNRLAEVREKLYNKADVKAVSYTPVPKAKNDYFKDFTDKIDDLIDEEKKLVKAIVKTYTEEHKLDMEINEAREKLDDVDLAIVILLRYQSCKTIDEIAEKMNKTRGTIHRKLNKALELIEL